MAPHEAARFLEKEAGGRGVLMGGVSGVRPAKVLVLGAGMAGANAAWIAAGMEAEVIVVDKNLDKLRFIDQIHKGRIVTLMSDRLTLEQRVREADAVIGSVLLPGARAPVIVSEEMVASMRPGSGDRHRDRPGRVRRHVADDDALGSDVHGPRRALLRGQHARRGPQHLDLCPDERDAPVRARDRDEGLEEAVRADPVLGAGVNVYAGSVTNDGVAEAHGLEHVPLETLVDGAA